jgi:hypothetical protein
MSATTEDLTATITTADGHTSGPFTTDDIERAAQRLGSQLSFDVGHAGGRPDMASLKIAGAIAIGQDLKRRAEVHVVVTDHAGEVLIESDAVVTSIQFKDSTDQHGNVSTERIHTATLG